MPPGRLRGETSPGWTAVQTAVLAVHAALYEQMWSTLAAPERMRLGPELSQQYRLQLAALFAGRIGSARRTADRELLRFAISPEAAFQEQLRVTAIERALDALYADAYRRCLDRWRLSGSVDGESSPGALLPAAPVRAFRAALESLDLSSTDRLSLYGAFEQSLVPQLGAVYEAAMAALEADDRSSRSNEGSTHAGVLKASPEWRQAICAIRDADGLALERDRRLAAELLDRWLHGSNAPVAQRLDLCGLLLEPGRVVATTGSADGVQRLRWSLIKIALADEAIFERPSHPLRLALRDLAAGTPLLDIGRRLQQIEISADFILPLLPQLLPIAPEHVDGLLEQLQVQTADLQEHRVSVARRKVASTLDRCSLGMARPNGLRLFLRAGWGPLLTQLYLQRGLDSTDWQAGVEQLEQLLNALADPLTRVRDFEPLVIRAGARLFSVGMRADRVERLQQCLREAYDDLHVGPAGSELHLQPSNRQGFSPGDGFIDFEPRECGLVSVLAKPGVERSLTGPPARSPANGTPPDLELFSV